MNYTRTPQSDGQSQSFGLMNVGQSRKVLIVENHDLTLRTRTAIRRAPGVGATITDGITASSELAARLNGVSALLQCRQANVRPGRMSVAEAEGGLADA